MKTYSRDTYTRARQAWRDGNFGREWWPVARLARDRGFIFPPDGTAHDDRDDEHPSQRAIVYRAIRDNPTRLATIVGRSRSWTQVVIGIISMESGLREDAALLEDDAAWERKDFPDRKAAAETIGAIMRRLG